MKKIFLAIACFSAAITLDAQQRPEYKQIRDISYRPDAKKEISTACNLDLYYPDGLEDFPTVVWFHGGGLTGGKKAIPQELKNSGMAVIGVQYRLLPDCEFRDCIDDAAAAVAWAFRHIAEYGGDPGKIFVSGHSAGGYLTNMVGLDKKWLAEYGVDADSIAALIPFSGHAICHFSYRRQLGMKDSQVLVDETAPLYHVRPDAPPIIIISGDRDLEMLGRYEEQAYFWRMLKVAGHQETYLYEIDGFNHGQMAGPGHKILKDHVRRIVREQAEIREQAEKK